MILKNILFISVDGVQNYLKSLFLPILSKVQDESIHFEVLEFCPNEHTLREDIASASLEYGVPVHFGTYFNKPPVIGSFLFIFYGAIRTFYSVKKTKTDILMPRSLMAGAMALLVKMVEGKLEIIYESDGLMSDERVDFGSWTKSGMIYKLFQMIERKLLRDSKMVITRTQKAKEILIERSPSIEVEKVVVIPNGKNTDAFNIGSKEQCIEIRQQYGINEDDILLIYVGTIGKQYRPDVMLEIFKVLRGKNTNTKLLVLTPNQEEMKTVIHSVLTDTEGIFIDKVNPDQISQYITAADIGLALRAPTFSQQAVCPLKVIEYLMCGVPVIANAGIGDMDELFNDNEVGYIIQDLDCVDYGELIGFVEHTMDTININNRSRIRTIATDHFDLNTVVEYYRSALQG